MHALLTALLTLCVIASGVCLLGSGCICLLWGSAVILWCLYVFILSCLFR